MKRSSSVVFWSLVFLFFLLPSVVFAQTIAGSAGTCTPAVKPAFDVGCGVSGSEYRLVSGQCTLVPCDPLHFTKPADRGEGLKEAAGKIVLYLLMLLGAGAFLMFLFGGVRIMLARGDQKMVDSGRKTILYAFIGLAVIFLSYAVLSFVLSVVTEVGAGGT